MLGFVKSFKHQLTISHDRDEILAEDLEEGLKDVLQRRGMAYKPTPRLSDSGGRNSEVSVM